MNNKAFISYGWSISSIISISVEPSFNAPLLIGCVEVGVNCLQHGVDSDYNSTVCSAEDLYA